MVLGLADALTGDLLDALIELEDQQITMLPAGRASAHPAELLGSTAMRQTIETLRSQFDRAIIHARPPARWPISASRSARRSRGARLRAGVTTKPAIHDAVAAIDASSHRHGPGTTRQVEDDDISGKGTGP